ncbi:MAG TPA: ligase-associated DNA damage response endonuclease PdeM [Flavobacterium sp.]|jgi:DNA ligase-associated metallophosphoesterase
MILPIHIHNEEFVLHCSGVMYWVSQKMLLISDVHLGKITHFRKNGVPVPSNSVSKNFKQLNWVVDTFQPETICFLGDLFHSSINNEWELFESWVCEALPRIVLIAGNHDIIAPEKYFQLGVEVVSEWTVNDFLLTHHPEERAGFFTLCGHIHPGVLLSGFGRQWLELPCFFRSEKQLILPAFGEFTGKYIMKPTAADVVYALTKEDVILVHGN